MLIVSIIFLVAIILFVIFILVRQKISGGSKHMKHGDSLEESGKLHEALAHYDKLISSGKVSPLIRWKAANVAYKLDLISRSKKELSIILGTNSYPEGVPLSDVKYLMAQCYLRANELRLAYQELIEIENTDPDNSAILFELGKIYAGQRLTNKAVIYFTRYLNEKPGSGEGHYWLGRAYLDLGVPNKAYTELDKALTFKWIDNGWLYYYLGILLLDQKKTTQALQLFTSVLKMNITNSKLLSEVHRYIALCYKEKGLVDEALTSFDQSEFYSKTDQKGAGNRDLLFDQGVIYYNKGDLQRALEKFQRLRIIDNKYRNVEKIVNNLMKIMKNEPDAPADPIGLVTEGYYCSKILKRGLLYSSVKLDLGGVESRSDSVKQINSGINKQNTIKPATRGFISVEDFIKMPTKDYKEISRKLIKGLGFAIKSEIRFAGDQDYIDGNAINFIALKGDATKPEPMLITIRRFTEPITELPVSHFADWLKDEGLSRGVFIGTQTFSPQALKSVQAHQEIKFIDKGGLSKLLGRLQ